jgi:hypothetical protein
VIFMSLWDVVLWGGDVLRPLQPYAVLGTLATGVYAAWTFWRDGQTVKIFVLDESTDETRHIANIPHRFVTRAEVQGVIANLAQGERLDFSKLNFDYSFRRKVYIRLPSASYQGLKQRPAPL